MQKTRGDEEMAAESRKTDQAPSRERVMKKLIPCPLCSERITLSVDDVKKLEVKESRNGLYPHIHVHGDPRHAVLFYLDKNLNVRNSYGIKSVEISKLMAKVNHEVGTGSRKKPITRLLRDNILNAKGYGTEFFFK